MSLISLFNWFLKLFNSLFELVELFILEMIKEASSLASNKIFLALIFALLMISCSCSNNFELSFSKDFLNLETFSSSFEISNFSLSIFDLLS